MHTLNALIFTQVFISVYLCIMKFFSHSASIFHLALLVQNIQLADSMRWGERPLSSADFSSLVVCLVMTVLCFI